MSLNPVSFKLTAVITAAALLIGSTIGSVFTYRYTTARHDKEIADIRVRATLQASDAAQAQREAVKKLGEEAVQQIQKVSTRYEDELTALRKKYGTDPITGDAPVKLRDPGARAAVCSPSAPGSVTAPGQPDGQASADLSPAATRFLWAEAGRADEIVLQLTYTQDLAQLYWDIIQKHNLASEAATAILNMK